jgi:ADP-heptose:LPS heptosyltransferase
VILRDAARALRYVASIFLTEYLHGNAAQRRHFVGRITRRLARSLGVYQASHLAFKLWQGIVDLIQAPTGSTRQRRFPQWRRAIAGLDNRDYLWSWTTRRYEGGPKIIVLGVGSIGDILQITPVLRALREKYPAGEISLLHHNPAARIVLQGNRNTNSIAVADSRHFEQVKEAVRNEGAADLVAEIESVSYILTYTPAPLTLRHPDLAAAFPESFFATATAAQALRRGHLSADPSQEVKFVRSKEAKDLQYLDVLGTTGNLSIDRHSALDFFTEPGDAVAIDLVMPEKPFVTVQNGVDSYVMNWSRLTGRRPTKLLPMSTWKETVRLLQAGNLAVVQIGTKDDERIGGVDTDLRGRTTLRQAATILKRAVCHVGVEGGLVHLARALDVKSVVAFGPTSTAFLGYPQNVNLVASDCTGCWWTTTDWFVRCPRGLAEPVCMKEFTADMIAGAALRIFRGDDAEPIP